MTTGILILAGAALFYLFEAEHILKGAPWQTQLLDSLFQSITPRTAGFNTVDIGQLTNATILVMMILMFIGASPGFDRRRDQDDELHAPAADDLEPDEGEPSCERDEPADPAGDPGPDHHDHLCVGLFDLSDHLRPPLFRRRG